MNDADLDARLSALVSRAPTASPPPLPPAVRPLRVLRRGLAGATVVLVIAAATASAGAVVIGTLARGAPGIENPGQPLAGANLECMSPPRAAAFLADHGYTDVVWQVERTGADGKGGSSVQQSTAPEHGYVVPGSLIEGRVYVVVDQRPDAQGVGECFGMPRP